MLGKGREKIQRIYEWVFARREHSYPVSMNFLSRICYNQGIVTFLTIHAFNDSEVEQYMSHYFITEFKRQYIRAIVQLQNPYPH